MLKRLIEVALPLKEISEQSAREKSIRHGHISTLHIWWARRPLAACRAVVFASLIPDPDDPQCPESFRSLVNEVLNENQYKPKNGDGCTVEDTPRNRCLEYIKHLVRWENSNKQHYIEPARKLIAAAHRILHPNAEGDAPKVLDPFTGGGAIPLEALRLGCEAHAIDLNPVAHLIELCTLVYPQKYGQPDSRPVPDYIKRLITYNKAKTKAKGGAGLFDGEATEGRSDNDNLIPAVEITEAEYRKNPLAADVKYWGHWVLEKARQEIGQFYPPESDGSVPVAYLWARTVTCPNPVCGATIPLVRQLWLCKKAKRKVALRLVLDRKAMRCRFEIAEGKSIDFDPNAGTMQQGKAACPFCETVVDGKTLRSESKAKRMGQQMMAVVATRPKQKGKTYRTSDGPDEVVYQLAANRLEKEKDARGKEIVPIEQIPCYDPRRVSPPLYGLNQFVDLFNQRQLLALTTCTKAAEIVRHHIASTFKDPDYATAVSSFVALLVDWLADKESTLARWHNSGEKISGTFGRQALGMVWDYAEVNPLCTVTGGFLAALDWSIRVVQNNAQITLMAHASQGSATSLPLSEDALDSVITDPPYYDAVPYSVLSDFFYVWLKRTVGKSYPNVFRTPLTPKGNEIIEQRSHKLLKDRKDHIFYERLMGESFAEMKRVIFPHGICCVMFAHKATSAWETLIAGLLRSGLIVTSSWPLHTEMKTRMVAQGTAALASSVTLVCRKRGKSAGDGLWDDVRQELKPVAKERLEFFWSQGIRGADFFISAIGPALSVFGKYERVTKLTGEEVTVGQFLDEVRSLVTAYALSKIMKTTHTATIDPESRFYVIWKWSYGDAKVPADEVVQAGPGSGHGYRNHVGSHRRFGEGLARTSRPCRSPNA